MRVFILCTGRSGSKSFIKACSYITNFSVGHESLAKTIGPDRFKYPENHIEADNRLSWHLGTLDLKFGQNAYYVHLKRNKADTVKSFGNRWENQGSILKAYSEGILMQGYKKLDVKEKHLVAESYYETVTNNIESFLQDKPNQMDVQLENIENDFRIFFRNIEAKGNLVAAVDSFRNATNTTAQSSPGLFNRIKNKLKS